MEIYKNEDIKIIKLNAATMEMGHLYRMVSIERECELASYPVETLMEHVEQYDTYACLLHDLTRGTPDHACSGSEILIQAGYPALARLVAVHHDLPEDASPEACLLYLADKLVRGEQRVSLEERFLASREKCRTPEALAAWQRRYDRAHQIIQKFQLSLSD